MSKKSIYFLVGGLVAIVAVVLLLGGVFTPRALSNEPAIVAAVMSRSINASGQATGVAAVFDSKTDKVVYAVLTLQNIKKTTKISYVRYLNGKYIDSKVAEPSRDGITNFYFTFEKGLGNYPAGSYNLNLYIDGKRVTTLRYIFK